MSASLACSHRPPCPGCPRFGLEGPEPGKLERLAAVAREAGLEPEPPVSGPGPGFRHRARLAIRGRASSPKVGLFQAGSHHIVDVPRCLVHHPRINEVAGALRAAIRASGISPYADRPHKGLLRYVQIAIERLTGRAQVVLVANARDPDALHPLPGILADALGDRLQGLFFNVHTERSNAVLGPRSILLEGEPHYEDRFGGARVFHPPGAFGQANPPLFDRIVERLGAVVPEDRRVLELYCGVGTVGLGLAARSREVVFNEIAPGGLEGLELGIRALPGDLDARCRIVRGPAAAAADLIPESDVVIADPPRKGLDREVLDALARRPPELLALVSCGFEAFLRDAAALRRSGALRLAALVPYDLFPYTDHVEVLALFRRT